MSSQNKANKRLTQLSSQLTTAPPQTPLAAKINSLLASDKRTEACSIALTNFLRQPRYKPNKNQTAVLNRASQSTLHVDGINIRKYTWSPSSTTQTPTPPTILLTHGFGTSTAFLTPLTTHLQATHPNHRIVSIDQAAHGSSDGETASLTHFISSLKALVLDEQSHGNDIVTAIGHSVGATALIMLFSQEIALFRKQALLPSLIVINPPFRPATLMRAFCLQQGLPVSLVPGMEELFRPSPEDVLTERIAEGRWVHGLNVLVVQDANDAIANPKDTEGVATQLKGSGGTVQFEKTEKLGHFKPVGDARILSLVSQTLQP